MTAVAGAFYTPKDAEGNRKEILVRTRDDLITVKSKDKTLDKVLSDMEFQVTNTVDISDSELSYLLDQN